jgi:putative NIF3 family GTP cyclohydrolase 1 type 2
MYLSRLTCSKDPIIFKALKSITLSNSQQTSLLRLAQEGISVYSPHTAVDAAPDGLNDWLADIITGKGTSSYGFPRPGSAVYRLTLVDSLTITASPLLQSKKLHKALRKPGMAA